LSSENKTED